MFKIILNEDLTIPRGLELDFIDGVYVANIKTSEGTTLVLTQSIDEELIGDLYDFAEAKGVAQA